MYKEKILTALRSGKYKQGQNRLRGLGDKFCCLGVVCDVIDPTKWTFNHNSYPVYDEMDTYLPPSIRKIIGDLDYIVDVKYRERETGNLIRLSILNDFEKEPFTFSQIADLIEHFYIEETSNVSSPEPFRD